ncbi:MAG: hypothetical protein IKK22_07265 [Firmicutes bacterium]|nr:hypothetical protein [Bacillota bacterium]
MGDKITNYQCPNCTAPLHFDGTIGKLKCDFCESTFTAEEIEAIYKAQEEAAEKAFVEEEWEAEEEEEELKEHIGAEDGDWDGSSMTEDWGEGSENLRVYNCPSCGAELICDETTAATSCPYCGNPSIVPGQFHGALRPDYVIPFEVDKERAVAMLKEHYKGKFLLPKSFTNENHIQEIKGVYVPFWLFDGKADADVTFHATRTFVRRQGDYEVSTTQHYHVRRAGTVSFEKIPVDASSKMPDEYMDAIEPFDYADLKEFSTAYLPGFMADKYDVLVADCSRRADDRAAETAYRAMEASVKGYMTKICINKDILLKRGEVKYALLPVWLLSTQWKGKNFLFAVNGQTGKMVGDLPVSGGKFWGLFAGLTTLMTALLAAILMV